jgi:hypothetical protein
MVLPKKTHGFNIISSAAFKILLANEGHRKAWQVQVPFFKCGRVIQAVLGRDAEYNSRRLPAMVPLTRPRCNVGI